MTSLNYWVSLRKHKQVPPLGTLFLKILKREKKENFKSALRNLNLQILEKFNILMELRCSGCCSRTPPRKCQFSAVRGCSVLRTLVEHGYTSTVPDNRYGPSDAYRQLGPPRGVKEKKWRKKAPPPPPHGLISLLLRLDWPQGAVGQPQFYGKPMRSS